VGRLGGGSIIPVSQPKIPYPQDKNTKFKHTNMLQIFKFLPNSAKIPGSRNFQHFPDPIRFKNLFGRQGDLTSIQGYSQIVHVRRFGIHDMVFICYQILRAMCNVKRSACQSIWRIEFSNSRLPFLLIII